MPDLIELDADLGAAPQTQSRRWLARLSRPSMVQSQVPLFKEWMRRLTNMTSVVGTIEMAQGSLKPFATPCIALLEDRADPAT